MTADTIYALSSGSPPAAIAVVRISGPSAERALASLAGSVPPPRHASLVSLREGDELLDRALVLRFRAPATATGEDLVELHLHGGRAVVAGVLAALQRVDGLRAAEPGEFTRRAFENGRIDLTEAEGLADLLEAETQSQRDAALALASGVLSRRVEDWRTRLLASSAALEAVLDFSDEGEVGDAIPPGWYQHLSALTGEIEAVLEAPPVERLRDGIRTVIAGPPNAGKSTLFNALVGREAAITSSIPGTTRDLVEAPVAIAGTPFLLIDTAGLRESEDAVEAIGVDRARNVLATADLVLWLGDPGEALIDDRVVLVQSKSDIGPAALEERGLRLSAVTGEGVDQLIAVLLDRAANLLPGSGDVALNARHRAALAETIEPLRAALGVEDPLIAAEWLRLARRGLDEVTGRAGVENMLDALFGRFCIGK